MFLSDVEPTRVAAVIIESVQGEGGFNPVTPEVFKLLRERCDQHGILLIADEIQSGLGRTGRMFAIEHSGVEPDLVAVAKALAGGFPLAGVLGRASIMDAVEPGGLGGTYAGSPLACVAALAVLDVIREDNLLQRAILIGKRIRAVLEPLMAASSGTPVANLRGIGAMLGFDVVKTRGGNEPDGAMVKKILATALKKGLCASAVASTARPFACSSRSPSPTRIWRRDLRSWPTPSRSRSEVKESGLGREGSRYGMDEYLETKLVCAEIASD